MEAKPFFGPKLKIARGRRHIAELESEISAYLDRDPWAMLLQLDKNSGKHIIAQKGREEIPDNFSIVFGDAVHNFRTALDILANDIIALSGVKPRKVYFPFGDSPTGFEDQMKSKMSQASEDVQAIVRSFQPYRGGNETLRAMHDLDIGDKHIAIMSVAASTATPALPMRQTGYERIPGDKPNRLSFEADFGALKTVPIDLTGFVPDPHHIVTVGKLVGSELDFVLCKGLPLAGRPVVKSLNDMGDLAERIVETFETHYLGANAKPLTHLGTKGE